MAMSLLQSIILAHRPLSTLQGLHHHDLWQRSHPSPYLPHRCPVLRHHVYLEVLPQLHPRLQLHTNIHCKQGPRHR